MSPKEVLAKSLLGFIAKNGRQVQISRATETESWKSINVNPTYEHEVYAPMVKKAIEASEEIPQNTREIIIT
jgi:hypothetical protein